MLSKNTEIVSSLLFLSQGVGVLHLYQGRPLCSIPLSPYHSSHVDVNGDGTIDHIQAVVNPMEGMYIIQVYMGGGGQILSWVVSPHLGMCCPPPAWERSTNLKGYKVCHPFNFIHPS